MKKVILIAVMAIFSSGVFAAKKKENKLSADIKKHSLVSKKQINQKLTNLENKLLIKKPQGPGVICLRGYCTENIYCGYVGFYYDFIDMIIWQNELDWADCSNFAVD